MRTLKDILLERSLLGSDLDAELAAGDDILNAAVQEFETIVSAVSNHKIWTKRTVSSYRGNRTIYRLDFKIDAISNLRHLKPNNLLLINAIKNDEAGNWEMCFMLHTNTGSVRDYKSFRWELPCRKVRNFPTLIKDYILPYFKDLNTFIEVFDKK